MGNMQLIKGIWPYVNKFKWGLLLGTVLLLVQATANILTVGLQKELIDEVFLQQQFEKLPTILIVYAAAIIAFTVLFTLGPYILHKHGYRLRIYLASSIMRHLHKLRYRDFQKKKTGEYVYHFTNDAYGLANMISYEIPIGIFQLFNVIVLTVIIGIASPVILACIIVFSTIYLFLGRYLGKRYHAVSGEVHSHRSNLLVFLEQGISSTREVIAFHRMKWEKAMYDKLFRSFYDAVMKEGKLANKQMIYSSPLKWGANLLVLAYGGYQTIQGNLTIGTLVIVYQFTSQLMESFQGFFELYLHLSGQAALVGRVNGIFQREVQKEGTSRLHSEIQEISFENVWLRTENDEKDILKGVNLQFEKGKKIAIVGTSGAGKSTIANLLFKLVEPSQGTIKVNGVALDKLSQHDVLDRFSICFQEPYLIKGTLRTNMLLGRKDISEEWLVETCKKVGIYHYVQSLPFGFETMVEERGTNISGGERQRLMIVRALLNNPEVLILDEATSALDVDTEKLVQDHLDVLRKGKTTIVIAHRLSTIKNADIIYVLDQGKVVEKGSHKELSKGQTLYRKMIQESLASLDTGEMVS